MRILLVGSTSHVASFFVEEGGRRGWELFGLSRDRVRQEVLYGRASIAPMAVDIGEAMALEAVDAIVNFAYPRNLSTFKIHAATRRLLGDIAALARRLSPKVVVQVSTKTVFGYSFSRNPRPVPVWWAAGDRYVETKALAEWLFLLASRRARYVPVILRLGNVIGPGAYWVSEIARRILFEEPVGRGQSNATYVRNVADYLATLVTTDEHALRRFGVFHHLAEFSSVSWARFVEAIAAVTGRLPVYQETPARSQGLTVRKLATTMAAYLSAILPTSWQDRAEELRGGRHRYFTARGRFESSGWASPPGLHEALEFRSHTLPGWSTRFDLAAALDETVAWVRHAGYAASSDLAEVSGAPR